MQFVDVLYTILIVVGSDVRAEERDRPLAYRLKGEIDARGDPEQLKKAIVLGDQWYLQNKVYQACPTIAIGGAGVNHLTAMWMTSLPATISKGKTAFIQLDEDFSDTRVAIWGTNHVATGAAVDVFVTQHLNRYLDVVWKRQKKGS
ncbi:hypothetical protein AMJ39_01520 [candidate division TA06 bacterium DG_24]|uniref:Uncharacterized protein n=3 Tax=Bacteria division TA06 TaxID=1156500 RepID=A0A0S8JPA6_UNCT6|nr:MAG: hypothetical protein AMJ39_01520 [candidate division TA06 bacterium DG_24]KPK69371.1 MAG: hypothetical protein AMJ82_05745 [candidate division TA06 bacterium SM23_40]KPL11519.1 MAG: hypothetical protein AMJ71_00505 [candidate division TA06 bacterium SM1_40]